MSAQQVKLLEEIKDIRRINNLAWMDILALALSHAPKLTKRLISDINRNDAEISERLKKLSKS